VKAPALTALDVAHGTGSRKRSTFKDHRRIMDIPLKHPPFRRLISEEAENSRFSGEREIILARLLPFLADAISSHSLDAVQQRTSEVIHN
jgi:hypothetical protein